MGRQETGLVIISFPASVKFKNLYILQFYLYFLFVILVILDVASVTLRQPKRLATTNATEI